MKTLTRRGVNGLLAAGSLSVFAGAFPAISRAAQSELKFWHCYTQPKRIAAMQELAARFKEKTGVTVNLEVVPWGNLRDKWTAAAASGTLPDCSVSTTGEAVAMNAAGVTLDLSEMLARMGGKEKFAGQMVDGFSMYKGQVVSLPHYTNGLLLAYRKDVFNELGIAPPSTWAEYIDAASKATKAPARYGMVQMWDPSGNGATSSLFMFTRSIGGAFTDAEGNSTLNSKEVVDAIGQLMDLYKVGSPAGELSIAYPAQFYELFNAGKTAMAFDTLFVATSFAEAHPDLFDAGALDFAAGPVKDTVGSQADVAHMVFMKGPRESEAAAWYEFLLEDSNYIEFLHTIPGGMFPVTKAAVENPAFLDNAQIKKIRNGVDLALKYLPTGRAIGCEHGLNASAALIDQGGIIERMMQSIVLNGVAPTAAADSAHAEFQKLIDRLTTR